MLVINLCFSIKQNNTNCYYLKVVGIPSPTLRWFRDGEEIKSGQKKMLVPYDQGFILEGKKISTTAIVCKLFFVLYPTYNCIKHTC